jgi:hypothetical protein
MKPTANVNPLGAKQMARRSRGPSYVLVLIIFGLRKDGRRENASRDGSSSIELGRVLYNHPRLYIFFDFSNNICSISKFVKLYHYHHVVCRLGQNSIPHGKRWPMRTQVGDGFKFNRTASRSLQPIMRRPMRRRAFLSF